MVKYGDPYSEFVLKYFNFNNKSPLFAKNEIVNFHSLKYKLNQCFMSSSDNQ